MGKGSEMGGVVIVTCEHASARVAQDCELGVSDDVRLSHVGWDPGAAEIALALGRDLGCACILGEYSRLVVDLNRPPESAAAVPAVAFAVIVPGNARLSDAERSARMDRFHAPHWRRVVGCVDRCIAGSGRCLHVAVHSFDPAMEPEARRFDAGVLFDPARRPEAHIAAGIIDALAGAGYDTRANQPYLGTDEGMTTWLRERYPAELYAGIEIEVSQALAVQPGPASELARALRQAIVQCARAWPRLSGDGKQ